MQMSCDTRTPHEICYEVPRRLGCNTMNCYKCSPAIRRNIMPPSSGSRNKARKQYHPVVYLLGLSPCLKYGVRRDFGQIHKAVSCVVRHIPE
jgi:hypothetical protein